MKKNFVGNKVLYFVILVVIFKELAFSALPLETDDIGIIQPNNFELETGYERTLNKDENEQVLTVGVKTGLSQKLDLLVSVPYIIFPEQEEKFEDASIGLKYLLLENLLSFSFSNSLGSNAYSLRFIFTKEFNSISLHLNLGYDVSEEKSV
ncbi:MAG: hypothetical protein NZ928_01945, partial [Endomicrobia bacterium]|nr:hypothetical protein [Endomicrobiia bacterium]